MQKNECMLQLVIDKVIGEDWWEEYTGVQTEISAKFVREQLASFPDSENELKIVIDSPGGDVFEGITIFNIIRDFARNRSDVKITTYIQGMAASMASVIALAANSVNPSQNLIEAEDNAVFMIHNSWDVAFGNRNELRAVADFLEEIDSLLRAAYTRRTGKSEKEIQKLMDAETWFFGKEMKDAGFVDSIIDFVPDEGLLKDIANGNIQPEDRDTCVISAKAKFGNAKKTMQQVHAHAKRDRDLGAAAMALGIKGGLTARVEAKASGENIKGGCMKITAEDLKRDNPDVYAQIIADGEKAGAEKEQARVNRLLAMGEKTGATEFALACVKDGANPADEKVIDAFMDKGAAAKALAAQKEDGEIPDVNPPKTDVNADRNAVMAAFDRELGVEKWEK